VTYAERFTPGTWYRARTVETRTPGLTPVQYDPRMAGDLHIPANRALGPRVVAGEIVVTNRELRFTPHRYHKSGEWVAELHEIRGIDRSPRTFGLFNGGLRPRLRLRFEGGETELFVVNDLDDVIADLRPRVDAARKRAAI